MAVLFVFASLARCGFTQWDDPSTLARNPHFNPPTLATLAHYWREPHMGLYAPVTYTAWSAIARFAQGDLPNAVGSQLRPGPFHLANVLLHLASACLVYSILRRLVAKPWPAALGALLFALHPVQVEPVAWISGLKDLLCGFFSLLAIRCHLSHASPVAWASSPCVRSAGSSGPDTEEQNNAPPQVTSMGWKFTPRAIAFLATLAFIAAMLSKPTAITVPLIAIALDRWMLHRPWRRVLQLPALWCLLAIPVALITSRVQVIDNVPTVAFCLRPLVAADALAFYLRHLAWPAGLAVDYARRPAAVFSTGVAWYAWLLPAAVAILLVRQRTKRPWLLAAAAIFVAPLLPVLGLRPFMMQYTSTVADHYLYLPMLGLALAAATFLAQQSNARWNTACAFTLAIMAWHSSAQTRYWTDDETLNRHTLAVTPTSFTAHVNLAHDLEQKGDFEGELREDAAAVAANPEFPLARGNYAVMLATLGHVDEAAAQCDVLRTQITHYPPKGLATFAPTFAFVGRELMWHHQPDRAIGYLQEALRLDPHCADARSDLTEVLTALDTDAELSD